MAEFFQFESEFVESLRCIPMQVRLNLDTCGVKLKLVHWSGFNAAQKQALVDRPCTNLGAIAQYREFVQALVTEQTGAPAKTLLIEDQPAWLDGAVIPADVVMKAAELGLAIAPPQWAALSSLQRFALIKLSRPSHENRNFLPAMQEFGLA